MRPSKLTGSTANFAVDETYIIITNKKRLLKHQKQKSLEIGTSEEKTSTEGGAGERGGSDDSKNPKPKLGLSLDDEKS